MESYRGMSLMMQIHEMTPLFIVTVYTYIPIFTYMITHFYTYMHVFICK